MIVVAFVASSCGGGSGGKHAIIAISRLPVRACKTTNAVGAGTPLIPGYIPTTAPLPQGLDQAHAAKLAWYEGDIRHESGLKVLAPRGWNCSAGIGADGGWSMSVVGPQKRSISIFGFYNGPGASTACAFFASAVAAAPLPEECKAPHGAVATQQSDHLIAVRSTVRAGARRLLSRQLLYWYPVLGNALEGVDCALPAAETQTCAAVLVEFKQRVGRELAMDAKRQAARGPTATTPPAASTGQLAATITGANGVCLPDVSASLTSAPTSGDSFDLRRPGNGLTEGDVVAVPNEVAGNAGGCSVTLGFSIGTDLGFFVVVDETDGLSWGPFDSHNLAGAGWSLNLTFKGTG